jgi:hypothetical protein
MGGNRPSPSTGNHDTKSNLKGPHILSNVRARKRYQICKPNSVRRCRRDGHSSRPFIAEWLKRPTRRFCAPSRHACACGATPSLFGLAPCGVCLAPHITARAVRSYRTFSPLPQPFTAKAVCSLLHWPSNGLEPVIPDVIRHTALRSSDFPLSSCEDSDHPICYRHFIL